MANSLASLGNGNCIEPFPNGTEGQVLTMDGGTRAGVGEWLIPAVCKTAALRLRRFESCPLHQQDAEVTSAPEEWIRPS